MINFDINTKCKIDYTSNFKKQLRKIVKQGKDINLLLEIITRLAIMKN
jgi:mRNA-degrading endonuclease YafQ of YafQ-DinJ toxin-antitoxin module